jgi:hypothetical protein
VAPRATTFRFSSRVERRAAMAEKPMARMAMGMADSIPWPSFSEM